MPAAAVVCACDLRPRVHKSGAACRNQVGGPTHCCKTSPYACVLAELRCPWPCPRATCRSPAHAWLLRSRAQASGRAQRSGMLLTSTDRQLRVYQAGRQGERAGSMQTRLLMHPRDAHAVLVGRGSPISSVRWSHLKPGRYWMHQRSCRWADRCLPPIGCPFRRAAACPTNQ